MDPQRLDPGCERCAGDCGGEVGNRWCAKSMALCKSRWWLMAKPANGLPQTELCNGCHLPWVTAAKRLDGSSRQHLCSTVRSPHQNRLQGLVYYWGRSPRAPGKATDTQALCCGHWDPWKRGEKLCCGSRGFHQKYGDISLVFSTYSRQESQGVCCTSMLSPALT